MELEVGRKKRRRSKLEDLPVELLHNIQSLLSLKDARRTSVLSKTWQRALSTIPYLRFDKYSTGDYTHTCDYLQRRYIKGIDRTLKRYIHENIPIISFTLHFRIHSPKSLKFLNKWIRAITYGLEELHLVLFVGPPAISLPNEIFSGENLRKISVKVDQQMRGMLVPPYHRMSCTEPKCLKLRELELIHVNIISQEVLDNILSACSLLEKIRLSFLMGVDTIKVKNLRYLRELIIESESKKGFYFDFYSEEDYYKEGAKGLWGIHRRLEISHVPNLARFCYKLPWKCPSFNVGLLGSMRELYIAPVLMDDRIVNLIKSKFPLLESLTLDVKKSCLIETLDITCASLKRLKIRLLLLPPKVSRQIIIQVDAPKLLSFRYTGKEVPRLIFPTNNILPKQMKLSLKVSNPVDCSFFVKLRENLNLSSNCVIKISSFDYFHAVPFNVDIDELRTMVVPATNVNKVIVKFETYVSDHSFWDHSAFFDAVFCICLPNYIEADDLDNDSNELLLNAMLEAKKTRKNLKQVKVKHFSRTKWKTLTTSFIQGTCGHIFYFRVTWCSS